MNRPKAEFQRHSLLELDPLNDILMRRLVRMGYVIQMVGGVHRFGLAIIVPSVDARDRNGSFWPDSGVFRSLLSSGRKHSSLFLKSDCEHRFSRLKLLLK